MYQLRRTAFLSLVLAVVPGLTLAQSSSSLLLAQAQEPDTPAATQPAAQSPTAIATQQGLSVQARLRARREQRRLAAIHDVYTHLYEAYIGIGFNRTVAGNGAKGGIGGLQKVNLYAWNVGFTRYYSERWGVTLDGRGYYGTQFLGPNPTNIIKPAISEYSGLIGPDYRFILHPRYSVSGRVLVGAVFNNYFADANGFTSPLLGLYPDGVAGVISVSAPVEYNVSPTLGLRCAPEYYLSTFDTSIQNGLGFTGAIVYRWGKQ